MIKRYGLGLLVGLAAACGGSDESAGDDFGEVDLELSEAPPPSAQQPVSFGRATKERANGVDIRDKPHDKPRVLYSVRLPALSHTEKLRLRAELTLSRCNKKDIAGLSGDAKTTPCDTKKMKKRPYGYNPRFSARFVLAGSEGDASGQPLSQWFDTKCTEGKHHCALAMPEVAFDDPPDAAERFVNLVVTADADGHNAKSWHVMEVEKGKGALYVTRLAPGAATALADKTEKLLATKPMGIDRPKEDGDPTQVRQLLYQLELTGLAPGDVVAADARMTALLGGYKCDPLITGSLILTASPDARAPKGKHDQALTARNGHNCPDHSKDGCRYEKSGAAKLGAGAPSTMYLSYVATALRSCAKPGGGDKWQVRSKGGFLAVNVRR
jgi:hypothetical protein